MKQVRTLRFQIRKLCMCVYIYIYVQYNIMLTTYVYLVLQQKIVVRIPNLNAEKIRAKAMKIVAKLEGMYELKFLLQFKP